MVVAKGVERNERHEKLLRKVMKHHFSTSRNCRIFLPFFEGENNYQDTFIGSFNKKLKMEVLPNIRLNMGNGQQHFLYQVPTLL